MTLQDNFAIDEGKIYKVNFGLTRSEWEVLNFTNEAKDILFHISIRKDENTIVLNHKEEKRWLKEISMGFPLKTYDDLSIYLKTNSDYVDIYIEEFKILSYPIDLAEFKNINSNIELKVEDNFTEKDRFTFLGHELILPEVSQEEALVDLVHFSNMDTDFFKTEVFGKNKVIFEDCSSTHISSILLAKIYPDTIIVPIIAKDELPSLKNLVESNKQKNVFLYDKIDDETGDLGPFYNEVEFQYAKKIDEHIFMSRDIFSNKLTLNLYKQLTLADKRVSLLTQESDIPNVKDIYFDDRVEDQNLEINILNSRWQFNQSALGEYKKYRHGLDVVVAMYNTLDYIIECVDSILCEGRDDIRIILVNDGSTDNSLDIVQDYYRKNKLVTITSKHNGGCASARNMGYMMSDASHITFFDSDDMVDKNFFAKLYDLALFSGNEIVQGGFDFYHEGEDQEYISSYEDAQFKEYERVKFADNDVISINSDELLLGQPTIWRRVYRRDFLESKNIFFPENIRAYDDYIFHLFSVYYAGDLLMIPDIKVHYRQHAEQDIKKGDERHFNELYMFRMLIRRSIDEGWPNFEIFAKSMVNTINWSLGILRDDLIIDFIKSSADICASLRKIYGQDVFRLRELNTISHPDFMYYLKESEANIGHLHDGHHWSYFINLYDNSATIKFAKSMSKPL